MISVLVLNIFSLLFMFYCLIQINSGERSIELLKVLELYYKN